jgi:membrane protease subunit HflC
MSNRMIVLVGLALLGLATINSAFFVVDQRERVALFQLGEIRSVDFPAGLHFKVPFVQSVSRFDRRILTLDNQTEDFLTAERKNVRVDYFVKWRIAETTTYYRATGGQELVAADRLSAIINRGLRDQFGTRTIQQAVSGERGEITKALEKGVYQSASELGIAIIDVRVKRIDFPEDVRDKVYDRMRAERTRVATELRAKGSEQAERIRAEADRVAQTTIANAYSEAEKLRGQGDAKASEIYAKAYSQDPEFYSFYRSLNVYKESFGSQQDLLVLEPEGEFFRYFKQSGGR